MDRIWPSIKITLPLFKCLLEQSLVKMTTLKKLLLSVFNMDIYMLNSAILSLVVLSDMFVLNSINIATHSLT